MKRMHCTKIISVVTLSAIAAATFAAAKAAIPKPKDQIAETAAASAAMFNASAAIVSSLAFFAR